MVRIFDTSAVVEIFAGNRLLMELLDQIHDGYLVGALPANAMSGAQAVMGAPASHWAPILALPGVHTIPVTDHNALEIGMIAAPRTIYHPVYESLINPLMTAQVLHEAIMMNGSIVTKVPEAYGGHDVSVISVN
ncbi:hypothetical protein [Actinoplanes couchii]|uniref:Uncharacterized protein n=1 Tax=Actinoplanes couchii TaxID=403638 RepID=A0ABQ3XLZ8_9ACTN|nr:hypothetical protein [Actinoplanes couchii]MDR6319270.1 hypothetical protein [Actinoplanes couchii]GID59521.1 hypothetical protein Aco03nite_079250 [Actinoplanes couchii]